MNIIGMNTYPWSDNFAWGEFGDMVGFALIIAGVVALVVGGVLYWAFNDTDRATSTLSRGAVFGAVVFVALVATIPTLYRIDDSTLNAGNTSSTASASRQEVESLEDTISQQLEARVASMGYRVVSTDVDSLTAVVKVGQGPRACDVTLDLSGVEMEFVIGDPPDVTRVRAGNALTVLADIAADPGGHPLAHCLAPAA